MNYSGVTTGRIHFGLYPGNNVPEITRLITVAMQEYAETYCNNRFAFIFRVEQTNLAKKFLFKKAAQEVAKDFPNVDSLALLEATNSLIEVIK